MRHAEPFQKAGTGNREQGILRREGTGGNDRQDGGKDDKGSTAHELERLVSAAAF